MIDELVIRESVPAEDTRVARLLADTFGLAADAVDLGGRRAAGLVLVACHGEEIVGTVSVVRPGAKESAAWLHDAAELLDLAVRPDWQGSGISRDLLDSAEDMARRWGARAVCIRGDALAKVFSARGYRKVSEGFVLPIPLSSVG